MTSPYNSVLAMHQLQEHADAVFPVENQALHDIVQRIDTQAHGGARLRRGRRLLLFLLDRTD